MAAMDERNRPAGMGRQADWLVLPNPCQAVRNTSFQLRRKFGCAPGFSLQLQPPYSALQR